MRKVFLRFEFIIVLLSAICLAVLVFRGYFLQHKILFSSNLLVSTYAPWKYEPVPEYPNGPPNKPMGFDDVRQFFPNRVLLKDALSNGTFPLWNPYIYSGVPFMASFDTAVWYPFSFMGVLLPAIEGWNLLVIIQPICSFLFMYVFLKSLKFRPSIAAYGAVAYALCGWMIVYWQEILVLEHSFLWLPLALYASNRLWDREPDTLGFVLLILSLTFSIFGGFLQMAIYVYVVVLLWNTYLSFVHRKANKRIFVAMFLSVLIACVQLIPSIEAYISSPRGATSNIDTFRRSLLPFQNIITLIAPDFWGSPATYNYFGGTGFYFEKMIFIGVIPLIFAFYAMGERKNKHVLFWDALAVAALSLGFAIPTSWLPYVLGIPVLSNSYPTRIFAISAFSLVTLSCFGLSSFIESPKRRRLAGILICITILLIGGWSVVGGSWVVTHNYRPDVFGSILAGLKDDSVSYRTVTLRNLIIPTLFVILGWIIFIASKLWKRTVFILIFLGTLASGIYFAQKYVYYGEKRFVYPDLAVIQKLSDISGFNRVWGYGNAFIEKNLPQYFHWFSTDGYGNLSSGRYAELLSTIVNNGKLGGPIRRSDTDLYEASEWDAFGSSNPYRLRMMSLFGVKYVLEAKKGELKDKVTTAARFPASEFQLVWEDPAWRIWQYRKVLPRATFATSFLVRRDPQDIVNTVYDTSVDLTKTVVLEKEPGLHPTKIATGSASITSYGLNRVTVRTESSAGGFVVLSDTYYPGWAAAVDGKQTEVLRADFTIRAVPVPKGIHTVIFTYKPVTVMAGALLSLTGIIGAVFGAVLLRRNKRRR